jgi:membrane associated rhomboid family serine protease
MRNGMFVLPIGLEAKTRNFPFATIAIFVITCAYSYLHMNTSHQYAREYFNEEKVALRMQAQKSLVIAGCPNSEYRQACADLPALLRPERSESVMSFQNRLVRSLPALAPRLDEEKAKVLFKDVVDAGRWKNPDPAISALAEFAALSKALEDETLAAVEHVKARTLLSPVTNNLSSLIKAQFLHASWAHLIGNMLFFLLFAIPLEQRLGAGPLLMIYFIGGSAGLEAHLLSSSDPTRFILGASANVFAVAASFMIAFWALSVRIWASFFFVVNQIVLVPTWIFFPIFVLLQEFTGAIETASSGVAHLAHLGGFLAGGLLGAVFVRLVSVPHGCVFPFEAELFARLTSESDPSKRLGIARYLLIHNPRNEPALEEAWAVALANAERSWAQMPEPVRNFFSEHFIKVLKHKSSMGHEALASLVRSLSLASWPWHELLPAKDHAAILEQVMVLRRHRWNEEALSLLNLLVLSISKGSNSGGLSPSQLENLKRLYKLREELALSHHAIVAREGSDEIRSTGSD